MSKNDALLTTYSPHFTVSSEDEALKQRRFAAEKRRMTKRSTNRTPGARMCSSVWTGPKKEAAPADKHSLAGRARVLSVVIRTAITMGRPEVKTTGLGGSKATFKADRYLDVLEHCDRIIVKALNNGAPIAHIG
jgi:hypothetical protein